MSTSSPGLMRHLWISGVRRIEVLKPQVDNSGYDLVLEAEGIVRHVQLKAAVSGSKLQAVTVNTALAGKPSGCVVVMRIDAENLDFTSFHYFGGTPGRPLPDMTQFPYGRHTRGNAQGVKSERKNTRQIPLSKFERVSSIEALATKLFGEPLPNSPLQRTGAAKDSGRACR